jgi:hypothetical protein
MWLQSLSKDEYDMRGVTYGLNIRNLHRMHMEEEVECIEVQTFLQIRMVVVLMRRF